MCDQTFGFSIEGQSSRPLTPARWCSAQSLLSCISFLFGVECIPTVCPQLPLLLSRKKKKECISNYPMWLSHNCHHELTARKPYLSGLAACDADWMLAAQTYSQTPTNIFFNFLTMVLSHTCSAERCLRYRFERQIFTCRPWSLTCFIRDSGE